MKLVNARMNSTKNLVRALSPAVRSHRVVAQILGISTMRVWQLERLALWKVQQKLLALEK